MVALRTTDDDTPVEERPSSTSPNESQARDPHLLAALSQDLRGPLDNVLGWCNLLLAKELLDVDVRRGLQAVYRSSALLLRLVDALRDHSQLNLGQFHLNLETIDLSEKLTEVVQSFMSQAAAEELTVRTDIPSSVMLRSADASRLQQVFSNLIGNALKFTPAGGRMEVSLRLTESSGATSPQVVVRVRDNGVGMTTKQIAELFRPFSRCSPLQPNLGSPELGLGLATGKGIIEAHGGRIEASSPGIGLGSCVTLVLPGGFAVVDKVVDRPRCPQANEVKLKTPGSQANEINLKPLAGIRITVVDDDVDSRELLSELFRAGGATVTTYGSAREILAVSHELAGILITDISMPGTDGVDLVRRLKSDSRTKLLSIIAVSGYSSTAAVSSALDAGADAYHVKPVERLALFDEILRQHTATDFERASDMDTAVTSET